jgi:hypothetical protein
MYTEGEEWRYGLWSVTECQIHWDVSQFDTTATSPTDHSFL